MPKKKEPTFEESLGELEAIVASMETGDMPLAELTESYSRGVKLSQKCLAELSTAEKAMDVWLKTDDGQIEEMPLDIIPEPVKK